MFRTLLALTLPVALLMGAPDPGPGSAPVERSGRGHLANRLHGIRSQRIQTCLGVPESMAKSIADRWGQFDQASLARRQGMRAALQKLQAVLMGPGSEEDKNQRVLPVTAQYTALHRQQREAKVAFEEDIQRMLSPVQQGRFIVLMEDFQHSLLDAMAEQRR